MEFDQFVNEALGGYSPKRVVQRKSFDFALQVIRISKSLRSNGEFEIASQIVRSGTSIGANIEEAQAGFSKKEFLYKMTLALKEARESKYWLRLVIEGGLLQVDDEVLKSIDEIIKILSSIIITLRSH